MHIAFFVLPAHGHINPTLAVVSELIKRGHRVTYVTIEKFSAHVSEVGGEVVDYRSPFYDNNTSAGVDAEENYDLLCRELIEDANAAVDQVSGFYKKNAPNIIVYDMFSYAGLIFSKKLSIPAVLISQDFLYNDRFPISRYFGQEKLFSRYARTINDFMVNNEIHNYVKENYMGSCNIAFIPKEFQFFGESFDERFLFVGPLLESRKFYGSWNNKFPGKRLILISLGTVSGSWPEFFHMCIKAFSEIDWHVVISTGGGIDLEVFGAIPPLIEIYNYVPHLDILPHADLFVGHGGTNSTMEALYHGVPQVLIPYDHNEENVADRVEQLSLGKKILRSELSIEQLLLSILDVFGNPVILECVKKMQLAIRGAGGVSAAADRIELEQSRC